MKPPPFLLGAALAFWGWQSGFLIPGVLMALIVESAWFTKTRLEFSDEDFSRVWTFCSLLFLAALVYAFTNSNGPTNFGTLFQNPGLRSQAGAGLSTARTGAAMFRWLPMIFFPFLAAQVFSVRGTVPLTTISFIIRRRWRRAKKLGQPPPAVRNVDIAYAFFAGTLLAASVHAAEDTAFFWGLSALLTWALWTQRSRRFAFVVWLGALGLAVALGFFGQFGIGQLQRLVANLDPGWFARFARRDFDPIQARTSLGHIGELKTSGQIVIRLEPREGQPPVYLREASYRLYSRRFSRSPAWFAGSSKDDFGTINEETQNSGNWNLLPPKTNTATVNIACYLEGYRNGSPMGLLPLPAGACRLEKLPAYVLQKNSAGAVLAEGPGLVMFDAQFGPGATIDSLPGTGSTNEARRGPPLEGPWPRPGAGEGWRFGRVITNEDLEIPPREEPALDTVMAEMKLRGRKPKDALRTLAGFFADKFSYSTWQSLPQLTSTNDTPLSRFLLETRSGHCEYFATATVLLLRKAGIPARYAVGYAVHETAGSGYVVRLRDAHAWTLVWDEQKKKWFDFDTTPASWVEAEAKHASALQWLSDAWSRIGFELAKFRWGQGRLRQYILLGIVPVLALLLWQIIFRRGRRSQRAAETERAEVYDWPGLDSEFYQLEQKLAERGVPRGASEPLNEWLERVAENPGLAEVRGPLRELLRLHYRYRFDPLGLSEADREVLRTETRACLESLSRKEEVAAVK